MSGLFKTILITCIAGLLTTNCNSQNKTLDSGQQATSSSNKPNTRDTLSRPVQWTIDREGLFTAEQRKTLDSIISDFEKKTSIEICIVTIDSSMTTKEDLENFVVKLHNTLGVGKKLANNGIVIGISSVYRKMRVSTGYGIEKMLSDEETKYIIDNSFTPIYKKGDYYGGTLNGLKALIAKLNEKLPLKF